MNKLHLKYKRDTGQEATKYMGWIDDIEFLDEDYCLPTPEYVKWLEERAVYLLEMER